MTKNKVARGQKQNLWAKHSQSSKFDNSPAKLYRALANLFLFLKFWINIPEISIKLFASRHFPLKEKQTPFSRLYQKLILLS